MIVLLSISNIPLDSLSIHTSLSIMWEFVFPFSPTEYYQTLWYMPIVSLTNEVEHLFHWRMFHIFFFRNCVTIHFLLLTILGGKFFLSSYLHVIHDVGQIPLSFWLKFPLWPSFVNVLSILNSSQITKYLLYPFPLTDYFLKL